MVRRFQRKKKIVEPYLKILDTRWDSQLKKILHVGYWLNPAFRFNAAEFEKHKQTTSGLLDVIEKYSYDDPELNTKLTSETRIYSNAEDEFGRQSALRELSTVMPAQLNLEDDQVTMLWKIWMQIKMREMLIKLLICPMKMLMPTLSSPLGLNLMIVLSLTCSC
ncbi:uncharacterized protein LOC130980802 [Arachis stenosperma]|uniref:uncharacterized protein LOC130980802 n=1 Tax=Arachis stenosperma TaxID=217475 RepID=UPI0025AD44F4|nr:uncharacterized protein LOC130980802 [Arachis stenosperma]